jgi:hypothetical protein
MIYFSYKRLPELAQLPIEDRRAAWINFVCSRPPGFVTSASRRYGFGITLGMIIGIFFGAFASPFSPTISIFGGMVIGILLPLVIIHFAQLHSCRATLRDYVTSKQFSLTPISKQDAIFMKRTALVPLSYSGLLHSHLKR